tara:strand:+ start:62 stop:226 length:165 start_codon:yes stop_codon:yes gene_type:complete
MHQNRICTLVCEKIEPKLLLISNIIFSMGFAIAAVSFCSSLTENTVCHYFPMSD